jgi:flagellar basal-body rod modification protein FlgD
MQSASLDAIRGQTGPQVQGRDAFKDLNLDQFLKMLIAELQNQDPLNPMENHQILQQISQIREIESNARLTETLQSVLLGQNVSTASEMLGKIVQGRTDDGTPVSGRVERVSVKDGTPLLYVGENSVRLKNVTDIQPDPAAQAAS